MGYFGFVMAGGGLLGGLLTGLLDWRSIFLVNLPIGALVLFLSLRLLPDGKGDGSRHLDVAGAVTVTSSFLLAIYAVVNGWLAQGASTPEALTAGYSLAFLVGAGCAAVAAALGLLLRERPHGADEAAPQATH